MKTQLALTALAIATALTLSACNCDSYDNSLVQKSKPFYEIPDPAIDPSVPRAYVRYIPERVDDIAWENDRTAFRIYGPELETAAPPYSSGIDAWGKKVRTPIVNKWYAAGEHSYHYDRGDGMDGYKTGPSRGAGGIGIWNADEKKLYVSHDWSSYKIFSRGPEAVVFQVSYAPWRITTPAAPVANAGAPGRKVWQVTTITLPMGTNLNRIQTTLYSNEPGDLTVGVGLATHGAPDGILSRISEDRITFWDKTDSAKDDKNDNGFQGTGLIVNPAQYVGLAHTDTDNLLLLKVTPGIPFTYYAGNCWSNGLDFHNKDDWNSYIQNFEPHF